AFVPVEPPVVGIEPGPRSGLDVDGLLQQSSGPAPAAAARRDLIATSPLLLVPRPAADADGSDGLPLQLSQRPITPMPLVTPPATAPLPLVTPLPGAVAQPAPFARVPTPAAPFTGVPTPAAPFTRVPTPAAPFARVPTPASPFGRFPTPQPGSGESGGRAHFESTGPYVATPLPSEQRIRIMTPASQAPLGLDTPVPPRPRSGLGIALFLLFAV